MIVNHPDTPEISPIVKKKQNLHCAPQYSPCPLPVYRWSTTNSDVEPRSYPNSKSNHDFLGYLIYFEVPFLETDKASGMMEEVFFFTPERICHIMAERK